MAAVLDFSSHGCHEYSDFLGSLHVRFSEPLKRLFRSYRLNSADAEDLAQEVFVRLASLDGGTSLRKPDAFVFTLARNLLRDRARRLHIRAGARTVSVDQLDLTSDAPTPERHLELQQDLAHAARSLAVLKPRTRYAFLLHRVHGESYASIAQRMNVSVSMVEKHIMSATAALRSAAFEET